MTQLSDTSPFDEWFADNSSADAGSLFHKEMKSAWAAGAMEALAYSKPELARLSNIEVCAVEVCGCDQWSGAEFNERMLALDEAIHANP